MTREFVSATSCQHSVADDPIDPNRDQKQGEDVSRASTCIHYTCTCTYMCINCDMHVHVIWF